MAQQFVVPQFTDEEDKIFGPITVRQFIILLIGGGIEFAMFKLVPGVPFWVGTVFIGGFFLVLAFVKINGFPFHIFLMNMAVFFRRPSFRTWKLAAEDAPAATGKSVMKVKRMDENDKESLSRLSELSLIVDTGGTFRGTEPGADTLDEEGPRLRDL